MSFLQSYVLSAAPFVGPGKEHCVASFRIFYSESRVKFDFMYSGGDSYLGIGDLSVLHDCTLLLHEEVLQAEEAERRVFGAADLPSDLLLHAVRAGFFCASSCGGFQHEYDIWGSGGDDMRGGPHY